MKPERQMWETLRPRLIALGLDPVRVENAIGRGTPDVSYTAGWIELKALPAWPARPATPIHVGLDPQQSAWLYRRWRAGGPAWLMVKVESTWWLFSGLDVPAVRCGLSSSDFMKTACWYRGWSAGRDYDDSYLDRLLKAWLTWDEEGLPVTSVAKLLRLRCGFNIPSAIAELGEEWTEEKIRAAERSPSQLTSDLIEQWTA